MASALHLGRNYGFPPRRQRDRDQWRRASTAPSTGQACGVPGRKRGAMGQRTERCFLDPVERGTGRDARALHRPRRSPHRAACSRHGGSRPVGCGDDGAKRRERRGGEPPGRGSLKRFMRTLPSQCIAVVLLAVLLVHYRRSLWRASRWALAPVAFAALAVACKGGGRAPQA